ncbi:MAG: carboxypeptidase M32 [Alphaproteobacteria bacterium]|nr:MAG: carboxypeptidase M32 [Alphaproteobacteria bacterium]
MKIAQIGIVAPMSTADPRTRMSFAAFEAEVAKINDLLCGANLLIWDLRTMMPPPLPRNVAAGRPLCRLA